MDFADLEERPAKKRRFFVEDSPGPELDNTPNPEPSRPDALPENDLRTDRDDKSAAEGFDINLLSSFVGESLPEVTVHRLKELSGNDLQRGSLYMVQVEAFKLTLY